MCDFDQPRTLKQRVSTKINAAIYHGNMMYLTRRAVNDVALVFGLRN